MMKNQHSFYWAVAAIAVLAGIALLEVLPFGKSADKQCLYSYDFFVFNTICHVKIWCAPGQAKSADECERLIIERLQKLHNTLNAFDEKSELSRLNKSSANVPFQCSSELWSIILASRDAWRLTDGAFDVTISPLMGVWGLHRKRNELPSEDEIRQTMTRIGFDKLLLDENNQTVVFSVDGMALDFGGIAKGYALDIIKELLDEAGFTCYMLDFGGNFFVSEISSDGQFSILESSIHE